MARHLPAVRIRNTTKGVLLFERAEKAATILARMRGLLGRDALGPDEALWIVPCTSIHTRRMKFAIDAVFVDRKGRVTSIRPHLAPGRWHVGGGRGARSVVEVAAGRVAQLPLEVGDELRFEEVE